MAKSGLGCITVFLAIPFIISIIVAIAIFIGAGDNNSTIDFVKKAQITTIDGIQKKYNEMAAGAQLSSDPILIGNYEVTGKASSSLTTPHSQIPCLYYSYSALHNYEELVEVEVEDERASTEKRKKYKRVNQWKSRSSFEPSEEKKALPFVLYDDTGTLPVDPHGATHYGGLLQKSEIVSSPPSNHPTKRDISVKYDESYMPFDGAITVVGTVYAQNGQLTMKAAPELVISKDAHDGILEDLGRMQKGLTMLAIIFLVIGGLPFLIIIIVRIVRGRS